MAAMPQQRKRWLLAYWCLLKIIGDISGSLIKRAVADCVNKLAQFQFRMTVLKGRPLSFSVLFPLFV